nr:immunoglobulin heavy chain junction region [Mus musculus]MBK4185659.1 immunoglobulin heavy chain junction region [Mus musculus]MBK4189405.1 immunoglobulin heavy chain junction region [Mus musculus]MBK4189412.1 immunoglobulin heavy chain junction region [Mus musculus]MBK4189413.1 immunoglobulin heavy chain junction region [Mus musculus]
CARSARDYGLDYW